MLKSIITTGLGETRFSNCRDGKKTFEFSGGKNNVAINEEQLAQLLRALVLVPSEIGYPCGHRRLQTYCTDDNISSMQKLYEIYYLPFEASLGLKKMKESTFEKRVRAHFPDFKLHRLSEDECDTCVDLTTALKSKNLSPDHRLSILKAKENHGDFARVLRGTMREALIRWSKRVLPENSDLQVRIKSNIRIYFVQE
jgi:hypothetical protein